MFQHLHALCVALCPPHKPVQLAPQLGVQPLVPIHRSALAYRMPVARQPLVHRISIHLILVSTWQPIQQARECRLVSAAYLVHPPADSVRLFHHCSPYPQVLTPLAAPYSQVSHISANAVIDARTLLSRSLVRHARKRVRRSLANVPFFDPLAYRGYARAY